MLQVDPGREFMGAITKDMENTIPSSNVGVLKFTVTKVLLNVGTELLPSACLGINMLWKF